MLAESRRATRSDLPVATLRALFGTKFWWTSGVTQRSDTAGAQHPTLRGILTLCMACMPCTARTSHAAWDVAEPGSGGARLEVTRGRSLQHSAVGGEPGPMQGAIPGLLQIIEANDPAQVRTDG
jgi:hypothetical protein